MVISVKIRIFGKQLIRNTMAKDTTNRREPVKVRTRAMKTGGASVFLDVHHAGCVDKSASTSSFVQKRPEQTSSGTKTSSNWPMRSKPSTSSKFRMAPTDSKTSSAQEKSISSSTVVKCLSNIVTTDRKPAQYYSTAPSAALSHIEAKPYPSLRLTKIIFLVLSNSCIITQISLTGKPKTQSERKSPSVTYIKKPCTQGLWLHSTRQKGTGSLQRTPERP